MADVTTVVETAEAVAEVAAPVAMSNPAMDWKTVAIVGVSVLAVGLCGYACYKAIQKRNVEKEQLVAEKVVTADAVVEAVEE